MKPLIETPLKLPRRISLAFILLVLAGILLWQCTTTETAKEKAPAQKVQFADFAGSLSCASCHRDIYEKHLHTEHYSSTALASGKTIFGSFKEDKNRYVFNAQTVVAMQQKDSGFYQTEYINGQTRRSDKMNIAVGSGRKGQSYINVNGDHFTQLPITYFTSATQWSNSPGYPPTKAVFDRPVTARCLECHTTFVQQTNSASIKEEAFDATKVIYGIDCEKCHGPAAKHVAFQTEHPKTTEAKFIVNPAKLSRRQNLDICGLCHGGRLQKTAPSFSFQAGDSLYDYFAPSKNFMDAVNIDVHGNQLGLLSASKCFERSQLTCNNCHNPHENENNKIEVFSQRCQTCHDSQHQKSCKLTQSIGPVITQNCIDCHMPKQASHSIAVYLQGADRPTPVQMRTHWIKIYPDETEKVKAFLKRGPHPATKQKEKTFVKQ